MTRADDLHRGLMVPHPDHPATYSGQTFAWNLARGEVFDWDTQSWISSTIDAWSIRELASGFNVTPRSVQRWSRRCGLARAPVPSFLAYAWAQSMRCRVHRKDRPVIGYEPCNGIPELERWPVFLARFSGTEAAEVLVEFLLVDERAGPIRDQLCAQLPHALFEVACDAYLHRADVHQCDVDELRRNLLWKFLNSDLAEAWEQLQLLVHGQIVDPVLRSRTGDKRGTEG